MKLKHFKDSVLKVNQTLSTNDLMWELLATKHYSCGFTIIAESQTKGKGQTGNEWIVKPGMNLTCSLALKPVLNSQKVFSLNMIAALGIHHTLRDFDIKSQIKWPNDVLVDDHKIAGILIENQIQGQSISQTVLGIGLNVNQTNFALNRQVTSMATILDKKFDLKEVFDKLYKYLDTFYDLLQNQHYVSLKNLYLKHLYKLNTWSEYSADNLGLFTGKIIDIDDSGRLQIETTNRTVHKFDMQTIRFL